MAHLTIDDEDEDPANVGAGQATSSTPESQAMIATGNRLGSRINRVLVRWEGAIAGYSAAEDRRLRVPASDFAARDLADHVSGDAARQADAIEAELCDLVLKAHGQRRRNVTEGLRTNDGLRRLVGQSWRVDTDTHSVSVGIPIGSRNDARPSLVIERRAPVGV